MYSILNAWFENQVWKGIYWTVVACVNDKIKIRELVLYYGPIDPWNAWKIFGKNTNYIHRFTLSKFFGLFGCISSIMHGRRPRRLSSAHRCVWTRSCPVKFGIQTEKTIQICGTICNWNLSWNLTNNHQIMTFLYFVYLFIHSGFTDTRRESCFFKNPKLLSLAGVNKKSYSAKRSLE